MKQSKSFPIKKEELISSISEIIRTYVHDDEEKLLTFHIIYDAIKALQSEQVTFTNSHRLKNGRFKKNPIENKNLTEQLIIHLSNMQGSLGYYIFASTNLKFSRTLISFGSAIYRLSIFCI